jgi:hypothetical protein
MPLLRTATLIAACSWLCFACASSAEPAASPSSAELSENELVGSWTIEKEGAFELRIPDVRYRTVASLIVRQDGSYFAQVAPREIADAHFVHDEHLASMPDGVEVIGRWQGMSGRWSTRERADKRELVLDRGGATPALVLEVDTVNGELSLTNPLYAGRQEGKTDRLRRVATDCRVTALVEQKDELEVDALEAETFGFGKSPQVPTGMTIDLVGDLDPSRPACKKKLNERALRGVVKDDSGKIRSIENMATHRKDARTSERVIQRHVYDRDGKLRLRVTTVETNDYGGVDVDDAGGVTIWQERTYFDGAAHPLRTLVQKHLEQARVLTEENAYVGRRVTNVLNPFDVVDLPSCVTPKPTVRTIAADPSDPAASIAAPALCADE